MAIKRFVVVIFFRHRCKHTVTQTHGHVISVVAVSLSLFTLAIAATASFIPWLAQLKWNVYNIRKNTQTPIIHKYFIYIRTHTLSRLLSAQTKEIK